MCSKKWCTNQWWPSANSWKFLFTIGCLASSIPLFSKRSVNELTNEAIDWPAGLVSPTAPWKTTCSFKVLLGTVWVTFGCENQWNRYHTKTDEFSLNQQFPTRVILCCTGDLATSGDVFGCHSWGTANWRLVVQARGCCWIPYNAQDHPTTKNHQVRKCQQCNSWETLLQMISYGEIVFHSDLLKQRSKLLRFSI